MLPCPACAKQAGTNPSIRKSGYEYRLCVHCGLAWLDPVPDPALLHDIYRTHYFTGRHAGGYTDYAGDEPTHVANARKRLRLMESAGIAQGKLLDVGCAAGFFLQEARKRGWDVSGVDPSEWAADQALRRLALPLRKSLDDVSSDQLETFAAVTMFQVLEHTPDPAGALRQVHDLLQPSGSLVIETWDKASLVARVMGRHWQQVTPPSVIYLFNRRNLEVLLQRAGFELMSCKRTSKRVGIGFAAGLMAAKAPLLFRPVHSLVRRLGLDHVSVPYRMGDLITLVARSR